MPYTPHNPSHDNSYVEIESHMQVDQVDPNYGYHGSDEEFAHRGHAVPRPSRLRRLANALLRPFRLMKSALRLPRFLRRKRQSGTHASDWDFKDRTPATTFTQPHQSREEEQPIENGPSAFPEPSMSRVTALNLETDYDVEHQNRRISDETRSSQAHPTSHHSHSSHRSPSHHSTHASRGTAKPNGTAIRGSGTITSPSIQIRPRSLVSPTVAQASTIKASSRWSEGWSSLSHSSSLLHHLKRFFRAILALYHLPWIASPPNRITVDFIPALGTRSKYQVHRLQRYPPSVVAAVVASRNMQPSEGQSWYQPSRQQMEKRLKQGKPVNWNQNQPMFGPYEQLPMGDPRTQQPNGARGYNILPVYLPDPAMMPFVTAQSPWPYCAQPPYVVSNPSAPPPAGGLAGSTRAAPPGRPPSVLSFAIPTPRPGPRPVQNAPPPVPSVPLNMPTPDLTASPNSSPNIPNHGSANAGGVPGVVRPDIQHPPPVAAVSPTQRAYLLVQGPPSSFPPSYGNIYSYPYTPLWTPPQRI